MGLNSLFNVDSSFRVVCGLSMYVVVSGMVGAAESSQERFLREAPKQWLEYRRIVSLHTEGTFKNVSAYNIGGKSSTDSAEGTFAISSDFQGVRIVAQKRGEVCNQRYSFTLGRGNGDWIVNDLGTSTVSVAWDDLIGRDRSVPLVKGQNGAFGQVMEAACTGQMLWGGWFPLMLSSSDFKLVKVADIRDDGGLVKVEFEFEPTQLTGGNAPARSGMVELDPSRYWLIRKGETKASGVYGSGTLRVANEFTDGKMPVPFVSRCAISIVIPQDKQFGGKRYQADFVWNVDMHDVPELARTQFMLTGFGMSEPVLAQPSRTRLWLFWATVGLFALCASMLVYRRYRRWQRVKAM